ncbi:patatin-like phospholipase domain-containing protein 2 [Microcaecilia unicolor]|uniref:triacylglycerol lipase n=1 Tax=Microcaecilia unicolor TaxID=1415580 RepID=A0A6P7Z2Y3_9AMPH|nr:patatin-like phospholipase domain-containing protein 2 [Microcaecilia unicolor]
MFDFERGWNLSFAGCGFLGVYHVGVASCLQEKAPRLVKEAGKIYGASAGALNAAALVSGACFAKCCSDVMELAKEARKRNLGPLHPTFNLVKILRNGLYRNLPENAHELALGRLCISLTRVSDGENVLVSDFNSKEELIQALVCSSFVPIYCGLIPPSFRGVRYVDGGISDNLPQYELKNTIHRFTPFSGESDICPRDSSTNFHEVRFTNTSIQLSLANFYRLTRALFPPEPKVLWEMCQQGYNDTLRFLKENNLLTLADPSVDLPLAEGINDASCLGADSKKTVPHCRLLEEKAEIVKPFKAQLGIQWPLEKRVVEKLPPSLTRALQEACKEKEGLYSQLCNILPMRVVSYMMMPYTLPVESAYSLALRLVDWFPNIPDDVRWMQEQMQVVVGAVFSRARKRLNFPSSKSSNISLRKCLSLPPNLQLYSRYLRSKNGPYSSVAMESWFWDIPYFSDTSGEQTMIGQKQILEAAAEKICLVNSDDSGVDIGFSSEDFDSSSEVSAS